jgi:hypothetical protein
VVTENAKRRNGSSCRIGLGAGFSVGDSIGPRLESCRPIFSSSMWAITADDTTSADKALPSRMKSGQDVVVLQNRLTICLRLPAQLLSGDVCDKAHTRHAKLVTLAIIGKSANLEERWSN